MTHAYGQTDDNFYYKPDFAWKNGWSFSKATRIENADTYEQFYLRFAGVQKPCPGVGPLAGLCGLFF